MEPADLREKEQEISNSDLTSLSSLVVTEGETAIELIETLRSDDPSADPEHMASWDEAKGKFRSAFAMLPAREREVAVLLYVKNLTLREIGEVLEVSESRVSQIHTQLKRRIRERLEADDLLFSEVA
jgi:RNA polymerase sigma factor for flagellar operon FliA